MLELAKRGAEARLQDLIHEARMLLELFPLDDGNWFALEGPPDVAEVLNAIADPPAVGGRVDEQRLQEARVMYPNLHVLPTTYRSLHNSLRFSAYARWR